MKWYEITIYTTSEAVEEVSQMLFFLDIQGVSIKDPRDDFYQNGEEWDWDYIDLKASMPQDSRAAVTCYLSRMDSEEELRRTLMEKLRSIPDAGVDDGTLEILIQRVDSVDWEQEWKKYYHGFEVGKELYVVPTWEKAPETSRHLIVLDPGGAFGTGTHETTFTCMLALEEYLTPGMRVYDIGCGSGILAITAAKLGAREVVGIDSSPAACRASEENVALNRVSDRVRILSGNLTDQLSARADLIVANIIADVIIELAGTLGDYLHEKGIFIASGIIREKEQGVVEALEAQGFTLLERKPKGEWVTLISTREIS